MTTTTTTAMANDVTDGIVSGRLLSRPKRCDICDSITKVIQVFGVTLPVGVRVESTILWERHPDSVYPEHLRTHIGVGCGCYAKFHRQVVHIQEAMRRNRG